jgi:hypothetical protein
MLHSGDIPNHGIIKRVDTGATLNIWEDNWIPGIRSLGSWLEDSAATMANELFVRGTRVWNEPLIKDF